MGNNNPGRYRKEGREAFYPMSDPDELCPYTDKTFWSESNRKSWFEGWREAEDLYKKESKYDKYDKYNLLRERINSLSKTQDTDLLDILTDIITLIERK